MDAFSFSLCPGLAPPSISPLFCYFCVLPSVVCDYRYQEQRQLPLVSAPLRSVTKLYA